jgi:hypothetical protein
VRCVKLREKTGERKKKMMIRWGRNGNEILKEESK